MPEIKHFVVTQTREVKVDANSAIDAARIAWVAFENGQNLDNGVAIVGGKTPVELEGIWGNTTSRIEVVETNVKKVG